MFFLGYFHCHMFDDTRGYWGLGLGSLNWINGTSWFQETSGFNINENQSHNFSGIMVVVHKKKHLCNFKHCWLKPTPGILAEFLGLAGIAADTRFENSLGIGLRTTNWNLTWISSRDSTWISEVQYKDTRSIPMLKHRDIKRGIYAIAVLQISGHHTGLSENSVPLHPMVNDHYPY